MQEGGLVPRANFLPLSVVLPGRRKETANIQVKADGLTNDSSCVFIIEGPKSNRGQQAGEVQKDHGGDVFADGFVVADDT